MMELFSKRVRSNFMKFLWFSALFVSLILSTQAFATSVKDCSYESILKRNLLDQSSIEINDYLSKCENVLEGEIVLILKLVSDWKKNKGLK